MGTFTFHICFDHLLSYMKMFKVALLFAYAVIGVLCLNIRIGRQRRQHTTLERLDNTCGIRNVSMIFRYSSLKTEGTTLLMNATITVKRDISEDLSILILLERCKNKENLDTCEPFYDYKTDHLCTMFTAHSPLWTPIFSAYQPPLKCPLQKTVYKAINSTVDAAAFLLFPSDAWYWRVTVEIRERFTRNLLMCLKAEAHISFE